MISSVSKICLVCSKEIHVFFLRQGCHTSSKLKMEKPTQSSSELFRKCLENPLQISPNLLVLEDKTNFWLAIWFCTFFGSFSGIYDIYIRYITLFLFWWFFMSKFVLFLHLVKKSIKVALLFFQNKIYYMNIKGTSTDILETVFEKVLFLWSSMSSFSIIWYTLAELFRKPDNWRQINKQSSSTFYTSNDVWRRKKLLVCHNKVAKQQQLFNYFFEKNTEASNGSAEAITGGVL